MWEYSDKVKEYFLNPQNVGEIENPDGEAMVGSVACGDALKLTFKVDEQGKIEDAKFQTFGCASAIASASALTEMIKGKTIKEVEKITNQDIADFLGGLPDQKMHCSVLGRQALEKAIANFKGGSSEKLEDRVICKCFGVTEIEIERNVRENNLRTIEEVTNYTKAGGGCESCHEDIQKIIKRVRAELEEDTPPKLSNIQKIKMINSEEDIVTAFVKNIEAIIELGEKCGINGDETLSQIATGFADVLSQTPIQRAIEDVVTNGRWYLKDKPKKTEISPIDLQIYLGYKEREDSLKKFDPPEKYGEICDYLSELFKEKLSNFSSTTKRSMK